MKVKINAYNAVAEWKWDLPKDSDDTCGICRVQFEGTCAKCKYPGDDCPIVIGECRHCFHMHCITDWVQSDASQGRCPMCRQVFREKAAETTTANANASGNPRTPRTPAAGTPQQARRPNRGDSSGSSRSR